MPAAGSPGRRLPDGQLEGKTTAEPPTLPQASLPKSRVWAISGCRAGPGAAGESRGVMEPGIDRQKQLTVWVKRW